MLLTLVAASFVGAETSYVVREGDTLYGISKKVDVPREVLQACNGITDPNKIKPGMAIRVPGSHLVQKGETLWGIAHDAGVTLDQLLSANGLKTNAVIRSGDRLYLPLGAKVAAARPTAPATTAAATAAAGAGQWPLPGKRESWAPLRGIQGVAIDGSRGDEVVSVTEGEVKYAGPWGDFGKMVIVTSVDGHYLMYAGNEELLVSMGDHVRPGMEIARLGITGNRARLYFSVQGHQYEYVDPEKYLSRG